VQSTGNATINRSLDIVGSNSVLSGALTLSIPAGKALTMSGCGLGQPWWLGLATITLQVTACAGRVTLCDAPPGYGTISIQDSSQVLLRNIGIEDNINWAPDTALTIGNSTVVLDHCTFSGFHSLEDQYAGRIAVSLANAHVRCSYTNFHGGDGMVWQFSSSRGASAIVASNCTLWLSEGTSVTAGALAIDPALVLNGGVTIMDPALTPTVSTVGGAVVLAAATPVVIGSNVAAGQLATMTLHSLPGTLGALLVGFPADRRLVPGIAGDAWLDPTTMCVPVLGVQNGSLTWTTPVPANWPWPTQFRWQGLVLENGALGLTGPGAALLR
jgi:hypothetical protein